jgi:hypothetical protein
LARRGFLEWAALALLVLPTSGCDEGQGSDDATKAHVASETCPLKTPADWQRFLETTADDETWVETCASEVDCDALVGDFRTKVETDVLGLLAKCTEDVTVNPRIARCTSRLRRFIPAWLRQHTKSTYGFKPENAEYLAGQTGPELPAGMMDPPPELLAALPLRAALEETARDNGWPYLTHDSAVGGVRTFVAVDDPEGRFEKWLLVGLNAETTVLDETVLSFIAVQRKDARGRDLPRIRLHFRDYLLSNVGGSWEVSLPLLHDAKCYACHTSGLRRLIPTHENVVVSAPVRGEVGYGEEVPADFGFARLASLNERLDAYGLPDWNGAIEPADHGPPLGASLGCPECHDGVTRGVITVTTDEETLRRKVVDELSMRAFADGRPIPDDRAIALLDREKTQNPPLSDEEGAELELARAAHQADYDTLLAERFADWRAWTLEESCANP